MFSKELELSISQAYQEAREQRHEFLTVEHMLLALLDNASALGILSACGADTIALEKEIRKVLEDTVPLLKEGDSRDTQPTIGFQRVLQRALYHVQSAGKDEVLGANVLVAIFSEKDAYACYLLHRHDVTRLDVVNYLSHGLSRVDDERSAAKGPEILDAQDEHAEKRDGALARFAAAPHRWPGTWLGRGRTHPSAQKSNKHAPVPSASSTTPLEVHNFPLLAGQSSLERHA